MTGAFWVGMLFPHLMLVSLTGSRFQNRDAVRYAGHNGGVELIYLVRHGRTAFNVEERVTGWLDVDIEPGAQPAAEAAARDLADVGVAAIVSSPLRRALSTAAPLAALVGVEPWIDDRFGEMHVGSWEGLAEDEVATRWPDEWRRWRTEPHTLDFDGRETLARLNVRVGGALDELAADRAGGAVVVFTHDAVVRAAVAWALGTGPEVYRHVVVANCSITTVACRGGVSRLLGVNAVGHLAGVGGWG